MKEITENHDFKFLGSDIFSWRGEQSIAELTIFGQEKNSTKEYENLFDGQGKTMWISRPESENSEVIIQILFKGEFHLFIKNFH